MDEILEKIKEYIKQETKDLPDNEYQSVIDELYSFCGEEMCHRSTLQKRLHNG